MPRDLIVFGEDWGGLPSSSQHLVKQLAADRKVVWVNSIGLRQPKRGLRDLQRLGRKLLGALKPVATRDTHPPGPGFCTVSPLTIPAPQSWLARAVASRLIERQVHRAKEQLRLSNPVLWISLPTAVDMVGRLDETAVVYYCGDDFSALAGVDHGTVAARETELANRADLILVASDALRQRFPTDQTELLSHGVDYALFSERAERATDLPNDGRPIAGFYGSIAEWFDTELLMCLARRLPEWHFVLIGRADIDIEGLAQLPNVHLLGPRPHHELPSYSQHWTASILPFRDTPQIRACNPLKLREYLAAGRPVVSTPYPAALPYSDVVAITADPAVFCDQLNKARCYPDPQQDMRRRIKNETWTAKARMVSELLEAL
jgi:glycosyltransferase involved in cell wall biosynthesis